MASSSTIPEGVPKPYREMFQLRRLALHLSNVCRLHWDSLDGISGPQLYCARFSSSLMYCD